MSGYETRLAVIHKIQEHDVGRGAQIPQRLCVVTEGPEAMFNSGETYLWETGTPKMSPHASLASLTEEAKKNMGRALAGTSFDKAEKDAIKGMIADGILIQGPAEVLHGHIIRPLSIRTLAFVA